MSSFFGQGFSYPLKANHLGRLQMVSEEDKLMEGVQVVLDTDKGTCPLDPEFGIKINVYDPINDVSLIGWEIANSIEYAEPRAEEIDVTIKAYDPASNTIHVAVSIKPIGSNVRINRVFPVYRRV
jgi:phage baseplate assembly protein W